MSSRRARLSLVAFLLIVGAAAAYLGFDTYQRQAQLFARERAMLSQFDAMLASVNELSVTQRGYFEPGRGGAAAAPQFQRVRQLTEELKQSLDTVRTELTSPEGIEQVTVLGQALDAFTTTDTRVRTNLANDTYFSAADLVFSASATELRSVTGALISLKALTSSAASASYNALQRRAALTAAGVALVWTIGLLVLAGAGASPDERAEAAAPAAEPPAAPIPEPAPVLEAARVELPADPGADWTEVSRVCSAIARASSAAELRELMAEAAGALDASGLVIWLGAGEEHFPVLGHGYDPRMLARIGPLSRQADNATALAWRTSETQIVPGEAARPGALVIPLVSAQGCIGVLAAEVAAGREAMADVHAITTLFAAQLSTIVAAWPEPSAGAGDLTPAHPGTIAVTL